jgi:hypothetical protein
MNKEYISRDEAIRTAIDACVKVVGHGISHVDAVDIAQEIEAIPTAEVVEVVRCKNCEHFRDWGNCTTCAFWTVDWDVPVSPDDYCSYGNRKEDK